MCNQRTEKWVCKYCEKPVKEVTYLTSKCESQSDTGVCKETGKTCYETIDMYDPDCTFCAQSRPRPQTDLDKEIRPWKLDNE
ncbi:hypothetical protein NXS19_012769 [Fusarium pseudograminearum]|nr:hypothetical protein NXS19_012769 [Fusarium pseudograminearum]